jgi:hypothetical protein
MTSTLLPAWLLSSGLCRTWRTIRPLLLLLPLLLAGK